MKHDRCPIHGYLMLATAGCILCEEEADIATAEKAIAEAGEHKTLAEVEAAISTKH